MSTFLYTAGPMVGVMLGGVLGMYIHPGNKIVNILRATTAGIVLAAVSTELVPDIVEVDEWRNRVSIICGILIGASTMILLRTLFDKYQSKKSTNESDEKIPWEMIISISIDFFIDAMLIGMALSLGPGSEGNTGIVIAVALGIEMMLLTLTASSQMAMSKISKKTIVIMSVMFAAIIAGGAVAGNLIATNFKNTAGYYAMLAFGVAALIWLIIEELIADIGTDLDPRISATMLFIGFMGVLGSGWLGHAH